MIFLFTFRLHRSCGWWCQYLQ